MSKVRKKSNKNAFDTSQIHGIERGFGSDRSECLADRLIGFFVARKAKFTDSLPTIGEHSESSWLKTIASLDLENSTLICKNAVKF